ncbi:MAG: phosphate acyltransferase PlsX [Pseudomonadota bacterium]
MRRGGDVASDLTVSIDAMGGDYAPACVIEGLETALVRHPGLRALLFGDEHALSAQLAKHPKVAAACSVHHTADQVSMDDKPSEAVRRGRQTSMWLAVNAVRRGEARVAVSAGNTGALMAMAKIQLKTLPGITRPAIAAIWPTLAGRSVVLDLGANLENDEKELVDFAILGEAYARAMFGIERPSVALLNIGEEELKGREEIRAAASILREANFDMKFIGFVEGNDIGKGAADVIVTDGFTGNIALKTAEGTAKQVGQYLKDALNASLLSKLGALLAKGSFQALKAKMDPRGMNGGVFLGLNGVVVKSHGGTDAHGFAASLDLAVDLVRNDFEAPVAERLAALGEALGAKPEAAGAIADPSVGIAAS